MLLKYIDNVSNYSLVFDDDGRVAYAYLVDSKGNIISDVWLYNVTATPIEPEWTDRDKAPYLNPQEFVSNKKIKPIANATEIRVEWFHGESQQLQYVKLFLYNELVAVMFPNAKPGYCRFASKKGPLARPMSEFEARQQHRNSCKKIGPL